MKLINYNRRGKYFYVALILIILALLNFRIFIKNEIINYRIYSILLTNAGWYFFSFLVLLILRVNTFYKMLFIKKNAIAEDAFGYYKTIGRMIVGGIGELFLNTALVIFVIAMNLQLINVSFFEQSINVLKLSGIDPIREIPLIFIILSLAYCLLLETICLSMVIVKTLFTEFKYNKIISFIFFNIISIINLFVIYSMLINIVDYNLMTLIIIIIKTMFLIILWYILTSFLLGENNFSK